MKNNAVWFVSGFAATCAASLFIASTPAAKAPGKIAVVNFKSCLEGSKLGKKEQGQFDQIKKQMESAIEAKEKELNDLAPKFKDEYLDTLTPEAEAELKQKFKTLSQDLSQSQNQFYQLLNQAHYQIVAKLTEQISKASKKVAKAQGFDMILNEEACFYLDPSFDVSTSVVKELDLAFVDEEKNAPKEKTPTEK